MRLQWLAVFAGVVLAKDPKDRAGTGAGRRAADAHAAAAAADVDVLPSATAQTAALFFSVDGNSPQPRGSLVFDPHQAKHSAKLEAPVPVDKALLAVRGRDSRYTLHARIGSGSDAQELSASVPLCMLQSAKFTEQITLHVDIHGKPFHLDYLVKAQECIPDVELSKVTNFKTSAHVGRLVDAPRPRLEQPVDPMDAATKPPEQSTSLSRS
ncbi:hypothetical protein HK105_204264 [Polyrhizophydium stewartii]|uniref:ER membrane protein complex subunit 10 n=1 Tax=Polyrhizophydium stewartii TaxID=2732419 RepID=A0ABR4N9I5_9FUNG